MRELRQATIHDLPGAYRVCLVTGDSGRDASDLFSNPDLLGHLYVGPYIVGQRDFAFVVTDDDGVAGYCLGARDTRSFEDWAERSWWPELRREYPLRDGDSRDARTIRLIHTPARAPDSVVTEYPSHLHIDLLERARGHGSGRALIELLLGTLAQAGSPAVHLGVASDNLNAIAFYRYLGFSDIQSTHDSLFMGRRLDRR